MIALDFLILTMSISGDSKQKSDHGNVVNRALHAVRPTLSKLVGLL